MNRSNRTLASLDYTPRGTGVAPWQIEGGREREGKKNTRGGETGRELWWRHNSVSEPSWARVLRVSKTFGAVSPYVHNTLKPLPSLLSFPFLPTVSRHVVFFSRALVFLLRAFLSLHHDVPPVTAHLWTRLYNATVLLCNTRRSREVTILHSRRKKKKDG